MKTVVTSPYEKSDREPRWTMRRKQEVSVLVSSAVLVIGVLVVLSAVSRVGHRNTTITGQAATVTPIDQLDPYAYPIYTHQEAISRSLESILSLPISVTIQQVDARLISTATLVSQWFGESDLNWLQNTPIWLVGVQAEGVTVGAANQIQGGITIVDDPDPVGGAFFAWDANSGRMVSSGAIDPYMSYINPSTGGPLIPPGEGV